MHFCPMILQSTSYFESLPARVISLVPSQTELLFHLGLSGEVIGITKFCVHPSQWRKEKNLIGGTKNPNLDRIISLSPSLIIANFEENRKEDIEALATLFPVWITDVFNLESALQMIGDLGELLHKGREAENLQREIREKQTQNSRMLRNKEFISVAYLIWKKPYMTLGGDTFIHAMLHEAKFRNVFGEEKRYPQISLSDPKLACADLILLSTEPYPFSEKDREEIKIIFPNKKVILADGEMFSWFGSRLREAFPYLTSLRNHL